MYARLTSCSCPLSHSGELNRLAQTSVCSCQRSIVRYGSIAVARRIHTAMVR